MLVFDAPACRTTLFEALRVARTRHGGAKLILTDADGTALSYESLITASLVLGAKLASIATGTAPVGLMLPNAAGFAVALLGLNAYNRAVAVLNYTSGHSNLAAACKLAQLSTIVTSRRFVDKANLQHTIDEISGAEIAPGRRPAIVYLEDVRAAISWRDRLAGALKAKTSSFGRFRASLKPDRPDAIAVILFTSGTEGIPKGVALTNVNLVSNARQVFAHANGHLSPHDRVLNPLPMFHSFGLTAGTLMPLLNGLHVTLYPSPLHYRDVARLVRSDKTTVLFATDTFAAGYARAAKPGDLDTIRFVIAGAERVKDQTRELWASTKAVILEGYGATECAPVIAVNTPDAIRPGTVGRVLPGMAGGAG